MEDKFLISTKIFDRHYEMLVSASEEEFVRQAADTVTRRVRKEIEENRIDAQTAALRVALSATVALLKSEKQSSAIFELVSDKIIGFEKRLDESNF